MRVALQTQLARRTPFRRSEASEDDRRDWAVQESWKDDFIADGRHKARAVKQHRGRAAEQRNTRRSSHRGDTSATGGGGDDRHGSATKDGSAAPTPAAGSSSGESSLPAARSDSSGEESSSEMDISAGSADSTDQRSQSSEEELVGILAADTGSKRGTGSDAGVFEQRLIEQFHKEIEPPLAALGEQLQSLVASRRDHHAVLVLSAPARGG